MLVTFKSQCKPIKAEQFTKENKPHCVRKYCGQYLVGTPQGVLRIYYDDFVLHIDGFLYIFKPKIFEKLFEEFKP